LLRISFLEDPLRTLSSMGDISSLRVLLVLASCRVASIYASSDAHGLVSERTLTWKLLFDDARHSLLASIRTITFITYLGSAWQLADVCLSNAMPDQRDECQNVTSTSNTKRIGP